MSSGTRAPSTIVTVPLVGQTEVGIPFEYLARKFVVLTFLGVDRLQLVLNIDYRFINATKVSLIRQPPAGYTRLEIRRQTSASERLVDFHDGSILRAMDMNLSQVQTLHVAEEARDLTADTIGVNDEGHLDARNRKVINLARATDPADAVNLSMLTEYDTSTLNNANAAKVSADSAYDNAVIALSARDAAKASETNALASSNYAENQAVLARDARIAAEIAKDSANTSAVQAGRHEEGAIASGAQAFVQADRARDEADRAKAEADKLANFNALAGAIESVGLSPDYTVTWKGKQVINGTLSVKGSTALTTLTATEDCTFNKNVVIGGALTANKNIEVKGSITVLNIVRGLTGQFAGYTNHASQGTHIGWNDSMGNGESAFVNNRGAGAGGFTFRVVNAAATAELGRVSFTGTGEILCTGGITANGTIYGGSSPTSSALATDGNVRGSIWGGWLSTFLAGHGISDSRLKEDIKDSTKSALSDIEKFRFVEFKWGDRLSPYKRTSGVSCGVIAQEVEQIDETYVTIRDASSTGGHADERGLDMANLLTLALKGIQELQQEVKRLRSELNK